ncbi:hypothetical protein [Shewanella sp. GutDb-MelDb]|uniref:hypothetical protein n=1 Tax=Shewanella sp. GutDb-MelDb TaxID=2058316 RepID=UPI000C7ACB69|nr:hypothetical protein [Shewanella sp. GutDb-MelDb]PKG57732.1 hypothetical protein CXF82_08135 [Shewanella sp. GutDb-MelDb]
MSLVISANKKQALSVKDQLILATLPAKKRVRILKTLGRQERALARKRISSQTSVNGHKFAARADGRKAKMLKKMTRRLEPYVKSANRLELKHQSTQTGRVAAFQQEGGIERYTAKKAKKRNGIPDYQGPCSRRQAKALAREGYKIRKGKGKGYRRATISEIMKNMTLGQAGLVLRMMRGTRQNPSWNIQVSPRPFLGDTTENVQTELAKLLSQTRG